MSRRAEEEKDERLKEEGERRRRKRDERMEEARGKNQKEKDKKKGLQRRQRRRRTVRNSAPCVVQHSQLNALQRPSSKLLHHQKHAQLQLLRVYVPALSLQQGARWGQWLSEGRQTDMSVTAGCQNPLNTFPFSVSAQLLKDHFTILSPFCNSELL